MEQDEELNENEPVFQRHVAPSHYAAPVWQFQGCIELDGDDLLNAQQGFQTLQPQILPLGHLKSIIIYVRGNYAKGFCVSMPAFINVRVSRKT